MLLTAPKTRYLLEAPFLVVEVLSEGDVMSAVIEKLKEYADQGVPNIWLIDRRLRLIRVYRSSALVEVEGDVISTADGAAELPRAEIFAD